MYRQRHNPYYVKQRHTSSNPVNDNILLRVGLRPSVYRQQFEYKFHHNIHKNPKDILVSGKLIHLPKGLGPLPIFDYELVKYNPKYDSSTCICYSELKTLIFRCDTLKKETENIKRPPDVFQELVKMNKFMLTRTSAKIANLNFDFLNIIGKVMDHGVTYVDLCAAPGGFSYYLTKLFSKINGQAFLTSMPGSNTHLNYNDKLLENNNSKIKMFIQNGDITSFDFRVSFAKFVNTKVDFVLADGGIDCRGLENYQEFYTRNLIVAQIVMGMKLLKETGFMIVKFFYTNSVFMVDILYLLSYIFEEVQICKPITSRDTNGEKYILFKGFRNNNYIVEYMNVILKLNLSFEKEKSQMINRFIKDRRDERYINFKEEVIKANKYYLNKQCGALQRFINDNKYGSKEFNGYMYMKHWTHYFQNIKN